MARTKLIAARRGRNRGIERIYALKAITKGNKGYELFRVDRDIEKHIKNGLLDYSFTSGYDINQSNSSIKANGRNFNYSFNIFTYDPINEKTQDNILPLVNWLKNEHRGDLYRGLYAAGHERTDFQRVWNEAKRMIPFYDCVAGSNSAPWQVVPQCLLEAVSFIPTVAQPPNLNKRFGAEIARRTLSSHSTK